LIEAESSKLKDERTEEELATDPHRREGTEVGSRGLEVGKGERTEDRGQRSEGKNSHRFAKRT